MSKTRSPTASAPDYLEPYRKTSSTGAAQFEGKLAPKSPTERDWHKGSYSQTNGRAAGFGAGLPKGDPQIPRSGHCTADDPGGKPVTRRY